MLNKEQFIEEIVHKKPEDSYSLESLNESYKILNEQMDEIYQFVLMYSYYITDRKEYAPNVKLTMMEIHILTDIFDNEDITVTMLAKKWKKTSSAISQIVKRLLKRELVTRESSSVDGKIYHLYPTETGKELIINHKKFDIRTIITTYHKLLENFSIDELMTFHKVLVEFTKLYSYKNSIPKPTLHAEISDEDT